MHESAFALKGINTRELVEQYYQAVANGYNSKNSQHYKYFPKVSVEICDGIWEENISNIYKKIAADYPYLTTYQHYALTDVKYRRGNTNNFESKYNAKWTAADNKYGNYVEAEEPFSTETLYDFFWDGGHSLPGVNTRKKDQWVLFKYGYYRPLDEYWQETYSTGVADTSTLNPNDYGGTYLSNANGYTFIQFYQNGSSWSGDSLNGYPSTNIGASGCNVTSNAIALSALTGDTITPRQINNAFSFRTNDASAILNTPAFSKYASSIKISGYIYNPTVNSLITNLQQGKVVILKFDTSQGNVNGWAVSTHFVVCADYKKENGIDYVYVINPNRNASKKTGWHKTSEIDVTGWSTMRLYYKK